MPRFAFADFPCLFAETPPAYAAIGRRLGPVLEFVLVAMPPVLSAFDVFVFTCLLPRFQLWLVVMLRLPGLCPCGLLCFRGRGCCQGQWPISDAVRCACRCGCVRCIAHSSCSPLFLFAWYETWIFQEKSVEAGTTGFLGATGSAAASAAAIA